MLGAVLALFYTAEVAVLLGIREAEMGAPGISVLGTIVPGAVESLPSVLAVGVVGSAIGALCGRWVHPRAEPRMTPGSNMPLLCHREVVR